MIKRLVRLRSRRERDAQGVWLIEGARALERAAQAGVRLLHLFTCTELLSEDAARVRPVLERQEGVDHTELSRPAFEKVSGRENPDGLLALAVPPSPALPAPGEQTTVLLLLGLEKPGNLGALLRSADGAGVDAVLVVEDGSEKGSPGAEEGRGTDLGNPGVIRASQGSLFSQPVLGLPEDQALGWLRQHRFSLVACTPEATLPYWDAPLQAAVPVPADSVLRYAFYDASGIDLAVEVDNAGALRLTQGTWFDNHPRMLRTRTTAVGPAAFRRLSQRFARTWPASRTDEADDHFGGRYALLELRHDSTHAVTVGYYNVVPAAPFSQFKHEVLKMAERAR